MKAAIYNPYLDSLGGGERYTAGFIKTLLEEGYRVDIQWEEETIIDKIQKRFGIDLENANIVDGVKRGNGYDVCFWVSDGSIPILYARKNFLHFQFPFKGVSGKSLINKMKLYRVNEIICNSYFTKRFIDKEYGVESVVIYPPVDVDSFKPKRKKNLILYVGRFSQLTQAKRQDVLVECFKKFYDSGKKDWEMVLAGGVEVGVDDYVEKLRDEAEGYPIRFMESPSLSQLKDLFGKAKIFWSAVGYKINEEEEPTRVEHFGITVVEAMAAGAVPIIYSAGGYREIVDDKKNGFLWKKKGQLIKKTNKLIEEKGYLKKVSEKAKQSSKVYEYSRFKAEVADLL